VHYTAHTAPHIELICEGEAKVQAPFQNGRGHLIISALQSPDIQARFSDEEGHLMLYIESEPSHY
jgi:hypothetical protein